MLKFILIIFCLFYQLISFSQELNCSVQVSHQKIQGTNKKIFETLRKDIYEFINNKVWTENIYDNDERIECSIIINLEKQMTDEFEGTIQILARRPVYGSSYNSILFKHMDKDFQFKYIEFEALEFNENTFTSNLTSVLSFYIYIILGMDYDSFSSEGGDIYFQKALTIVSNAQTSSKKGWKAYEDLKNRYWLIDGILDESTSPIRGAIYQYHRLGLDAMSKKTSRGRAKVFESLRTLRQVYRDKPSSVFLRSFLTSKSDELVNIFSDKSVFPDEKNQVFSILNEIDPTNVQKYMKIKSGSSGK